MAQMDPKIEQKPTLHEVGVAIAAERAAGSRFMESAVAVDIAERAFIKARDAYDEAREDHVRAMGKVDRLFEGIKTND